MRCGFETIGNATLIVHDNGPVLATDPWIEGDAYFGSWVLSHEVPPEQRQSVLDAQFLWFSHGHPDHLNPHCLPLFKGKKILLPDHVGSRMALDLAEQGFDITILKDRVWTRLSERVRVLCIADVLQDAVLLVDVNGTLVVNVNDTVQNSWMRSVRRIIKDFPESFLLSLCNFGDVDMINFFDEQKNFIQPEAAKREPLGVKIAQLTESLGANYFIPFSSMHRYQRQDSVWANRYGTDLEDFKGGFESERCQLLPAFIQYDDLEKTYIRTLPPETKASVVDPSAFGDNWSDVLEVEDKLAIQRYLGAVEMLKDSLDFINFRVGGQDNIVGLSKEKLGRGITFEVPRQSLMTAVQYEIFDDLLIGNFMRTTLHGDWVGTFLYPHLVPALTKYADNGRAKTRAQVKSYLAQYQSRSFDYVLFQAEEKARAVVRKTLKADSSIYRSLRYCLRGVRELTT